MQESYKIPCPICDDKTTIKIDSLEARPNSFDKQTVCGECEEILFVYQCKCSQPVLSDKPFCQGNRYRCSKPHQCQTPEIQLVICPFQGCQKVMNFEGKYDSGTVIKCEQCKKSFQHIYCPKCFSNIYFQPENPYKNSQKMVCQVNKCGEEFIHYNCNNCHQPQFKQDFESLEPEKQLCQRCCARVTFLTCSQCDKYSFTPNLEEFQQTKCQNCQHNMQYFRCRICDSNTVQTSTGNLHDTGEKKCQNCLKCQNYIKCYQCSGINCYEKNKSQYVCTICSTNQNIAECNVCNRCFGVNESETIQGICECQTAVQLSKTCNICYNEKIQYVCVPCGHQCLGEACAKEMKGGKCPICRVVTKDIIKVFEAD